MFIGADPHAGWLGGEVALDDRGFVLTGPDALDDDLHRARWTVARDPLPLETSRPGVFAAGDVRSGSIKRVAAAVGEGSMAVRLVHEHLDGGRAPIG
jgi:thioredoxin reductase (NADPH)